MQVNVVSAQVSQSYHILNSVCFSLKRDLRRLSRIFSFFATLSTAKQSKCFLHRPSLNYSYPRYFCFSSSLTSNFDDKCEIRFSHAKLILRRLSSGPLRARPQERVDGRFNIQDSPCGATRFSTMCYRFLSTQIVVNRPIEDDHQPRASQFQYANDILLLLQ